MARCFLYGNGGGGGDIKLTVFNGTTAPANPQDNYVWIKTTTSLDDLLVCGKSWSPSNRAGRIWLQYEDVASTSYQWLLKKTANVFVSIPLCGCAIADGTTWAKLDAYLYYSGEWHQFSKTFSATITVTYPAGSVCTVSNGSTTYTAPDTTGTWSCNVDSIGNWTVKATKGSQSASQSVSITASGQTAGVTLSYTLYLYKAGDWREAVTGGWTAYAKGATSSDGQASMPAVTYNSDNVVVSVQSQYGYPAGMYCTNKKVDLTKYSTLKLDGLCSVDRAYITVWSAIGNYTHDNIVAGVQFTNRSMGTVTLDISSLSGEFYVGFRFLGSQTSPAMTMYNLYAE